MSMKMLMSSLVSDICRTRLITTPEGFRAFCTFMTSFMTCWRCQRLRRFSTSPHHHSSPNELMSCCTSSGVSLTAVCAASLPVGAGVLLRSWRCLAEASQGATGAAEAAWAAAWPWPETCRAPRSTSLMRRMATPEGLDAFWILRPDSIMASACSGVRVLMRSTTPSERPLISTKMPRRWSRGTTCLMRLTTMPLRLRAWLVFSGGSMTAARCSGASSSSASPIQGSSWCAAQKSAVLSAASPGSRAVASQPVT
mmetsp:Transcript_92708/g.288582  ORF Transcript_92708/g.288582 Transcript_92708/m.288582 type:complete len:254 (-) Transcript_92708:319-1080(-)